MPLRNRLEFRGTLWQLFLEMAWLHNGATILPLSQSGTSIWRPEPGSTPGNLLIFLILAVTRLRIVISTKFQKLYTLIFKYAGPSGVRNNTVHCHPARGNPLWWDPTWKSWNILFSSQEWLLQVIPVAVHVYSGLPSWVVDLFTRTSIRRHGQPCTSGMASGMTSMETGNCDISVKYCDIVAF